MKFFIDYIIYRKNTDLEFRKEKITLFIDELSAFCSVKKKSPSIASIRNMVQRGRLLNLGCILVTQNPDQIEAEIISNCKYQIVFGMPSDKDVTSIGRSLNLNTAERKQIKELQKFEAILISKERPFLIYDIAENEIRRENGIFKVHTFLSLGEHEGTIPENPANKRAEKDPGYYSKYADAILLNNNIELNTTQRNKTTDYFYKHKLEHYTAEKFVDQEDRFRLPKLIEGVSIAGFYYDISVNMTTISFQELLNKGFCIITDERGFHRICRIDRIPKNPNIIIHDKTQPKDVLFITWNNWTKRAQLFGRGVIRNSVALEQRMR